MVEVVAFPVPLHDIGALLVVDVSYLASCIRSDAFSVQPRGVGPAHGVIWEAAEVFEGHRLRGYSGSITKYAAAGRIREHGVS